jgi:hypothetical protein
MVRKPHKKAILAVAHKGNAEQAVEFGRFAVSRPHAVNLTLAHRI